MRKATLVIIVFTLFSKVIGFARDMVLSYFFGASNISDAYLLAFTIPGVIFEFVGTGIATSYIPIYSEIKKNQGSSKADIFTNNLVSVLLVLCTMLVVLGLIFCKPIVKILAIGFDPQTMNLAVLFTRISMLGIYLSIIIQVASSYLNVKNNFHIPALMGIPFNAFIIISIILASKINVLFLPVGIIIALFFQLIFLLPFVKKESFNFNFKINFKDNNLRTMLFLAMPVILGVSINQINILVDKTIASKLEVGGISALNYASRLNLFIQGIFVMSLVTAMYPLISRMAVENNIKGLKDSIKEAINGINLLIMPVTVGSMIFANPIVSLLFGRGSFDNKAILMTSSALFFYSIGMIGIGLREVLARAFYSLQDTRRPMINAAIGMIMNIILNIILSKYIGIGGLALATSISAIFTTILLFISLRNKIGPFGMKGMSISFVKVLFASLVMGLTTKFIYDFLISNISSNIALVIVIVVGVLIYLYLCYLMKIEDVNVMVALVKRRIRSNNKKGENN